MKKTTCLALLTSLVVLAPVAAQTQRIHADQLPKPVRESLNRVSQGAPAKTVDRRMVEGEVVYEVEIDRDNAINPQVRFTEDGTAFGGGILPSPAITDPVPNRSVEARSRADGYRGPSLSSDPILAFRQLPEPVRAAAKRAAAGRIIADIDEEKWEGRTIYEVEFSEPGLNPQVHLGPDGAVVKGEEKSASNLGAGIGAALRSFMGTQVEDTPTRVQETIRREAGEHWIRDIDIETQAGRRVYEAEIGEGESRFFLHVSEDGAIVRDTRTEAAMRRRG